MREGRHHLLSFVQVETQGGMNQWQAAAAAAQAAVQAAQAAQAACGTWAPWAVPQAPAPKAAAQNGKGAGKGQPGKWATRNKEQRERRKEWLRLGKEAAERSQNKTLSKVLTWWEGNCGLLLGMIAGFSIPAWFVAASWYQNSPTFELATNFAVCALLVFLSSLLSNFVVRRIFSSDSPNGQIKDPTGRKRGCALSAGVPIELGGP